MPDEPDPFPASEDEARGTGRKIAIAAGVFLALGLGALGALLFAGGEGSGPDSDVRACIIDPASRDFTKGSKRNKAGDCPPPGAQATDGLLEKETDDGFTLRVIDHGHLGRTKHFTVRTPDRPYIDIAHAKQHAALGQPVRVYTKRVDGQTIVVYMEDAPLLGS
jgi:hypothetical protein